MTAKANEILTGNYDYEGACAIYNDTDSCSFDTVIDTSRGSMTIEDAFNMCELTTEEGNTGKEYAVDDDLMVLSYDKELDSPYLGHINYIYRHKVDKPIYEIEDENGNIVKVTEDHSVMIERDGELFEVKPLDINEGDIIIKSV
jgi:intein/homing endonuclease